MGKLNSIHQLTVREVHSARVGELNDGGGLRLRVAANAASWVFRYTSPTGKRREMGIGPLLRASLKETGDSLTAARDAAATARDLLRQDIDPLQERDSARETARQQEAAALAEKSRDKWTLARAARDYHERVIEPTRSAKHSAQWIASLENHIPKQLWHKPIAGITPPEILSALEATKPHQDARRPGDLGETLRRLRQRLDSIFEDAIFYGRASTNPASATRRKLNESRPVIKGHYRALDYRLIPQLMSRVRTLPGNAARCLEFSILTISRTSEALKAQWSEFDLEAGIWRIPGERMKKGAEHIVFLTAPAIALLRRQIGQDVNLVFPSPQNNGKPMSNMAMLKLLDRLNVREDTTVHGLRATFSTWANETAAARPDVIEACLSHKELDRTRRAYNRAEFIHERKKLINDWANYLNRPNLSVAVG